MKVAVSKLYFCLLLLWIGGFLLSISLPFPAGLYAFVVVSAAGGFGVSLEVYRVKKHKGQLVCPMGSDCNAVITSRYAKFFGIPLEYLGTAYFGLIFASYFVLVFASHAVPGAVTLGILAFTAAAFLFSSYLLFVQAFLLRQWCVWCILAALFSYTVFFSSLATFTAAVPFLSGVGGFLELIQFFGLSLGVGGTTSAVFLFNRFLKDSDIDDKELDVIKGISELIWLGFGLVLMGQLATYAASPDILAQSNVFIARITSLFAAMFSGAILMVILAPFLSYMPFKKESGARKSPLVSLRKPSFIAGAVLIASWYFAFLTYFIPEYSLGVLLLSYVVLVAVAVGAALLRESALIRGRN